MDQDEVEEHKHAKRPNKLGQNKICYGAQWTILSKWARKSHLACSDMSTGMAIVYSLKNIELNSRLYTDANLQSSKSVSAYITDFRTMQTNERHSNLCCKTPKR